VSTDERVRIIVALADAIARANAAVIEIDRARESGDGARLRLALTAYADLEEEMNALRRKRSILGA
jgi:hypothetical protein